MEVRTSDIEQFRGTFGVGGIRRLQRRCRVLFCGGPAVGADPGAADCNTGPDHGFEGGRMDLRGDGSHPAAGGVDFGLRLGL